MTKHERFEGDGNAQYTAVIKQDGAWWIGWIAEVPGVNCQEATKEELLVSLSEALRDILAINTAEARAAAGDPHTEVKIAV